MITTHIRRRASLTGMIAALLLAAGLMIGMFAAAQEAAAADTTTQLQVASADDVGDYLTDGQGMAIYIFLNDTHSVTNCDESCQAAWPPVRVAADADLAALAEGVEGLDAAQLSTIELPDGTHQLVLNGWPLYFYASDAAAGDITGQGVGDVWFLATPQGTGAGIAADQLGGAAAPQ